MLLIISKMVKIEGHHDSDNDGNDDVDIDDYHDVLIFVIAYFIIICQRLTCYSYKFSIWHASWSYSYSEYFFD